MHGGHFRLRPATRADAIEIAETTRCGFESYRAWTHPGWRPPDHRLEILGVRDRLDQRRTWCLLARTADGAPAGHVGVIDATLRDPPRPLVPGVAHLWMLFVRPEHWGTGLAARLHDLALEQALERGAERIQLYTPAGQARARAFYERRGWAVEGPPFMEHMLDLELVRYVRPLAGPGRDEPERGHPA